ncbi:MAG: Uba/thif-type NAD/fad binding fold protein [Parcubacteria group bacterium GW2011_GWA1_36_12]|nr:MAG: Uba/thif-type NAD/fad binding fold protein [Parcubacteria group bacterium GW2011_GWA1_36_12]
MFLFTFNPMGFLKALFGENKKKPFSDVAHEKKESILREDISKIKEINIDELKKKIDNNEDFILVDIRTEPELRFGKIKYKQLFIPMHELPLRLNELNKDKEIILYCRVGNRTYGTAEYLIQQGFKNVASLEGGIMAWKKFDDSVIPY